MGRKSKEFVTYEGETLSLVEWAKKLGVSYGSLYARLHVLGWTVDQALAHGNLRPRKPKDAENVADDQTGISAERS